MQDRMNKVWYYIKEYGQFSYYLYWLYGRGRTYAQSHLSTKFNVHKITPSLFIGDVASSCNLEELKKLGITHILSAILGAVEQFPGEFVYKNVSIRDMESEDIYPHLSESIDYMDDAITSGGKVFVHCICGVSRSATLIAAYLIKKGKITAEKAITQIHDIRNCVDPNPTFRKQLKEYEQQLKDRSESENNASEESTQSTSGNVTLCESSLSDQDEGAVLGVPL